MISKPQGDWAREDRTVEVARQFGGVASKAMSAGASGVARVRAIYRAFVCAIMAIMLGWAGLSAGLIGHSLPTLIGAGCGSLLLGWVALRSMQTGFGRAPLRRNESTSTPISAGFANRQNPRAEIATAGDTPAMSPGSATAICYDRNKLFLRAAKLGAACALGAWVITASIHRSPLANLLVLGGILFGLWRIVTLLLRATDQDLTAISWDNQQICVRTLTKSRQVPWQSVESVKAIRHVIRLWGIIPMSTSHYLVFRLRQNGSTRKMNVPASALIIRPDAAADLMRKVAIRRAQFAGGTTAVANPSDVSRKNIAAYKDLNPSDVGAVVAPEAAEHTRWLGPGDRTAVVPPAFGRKTT